MEKVEIKVEGYEIVQSLGKDGQWAGKKVLIILLEPYEQKEQQQESSKSETKEPWKPVHGKRKLSYIFNEIEIDRIHKTRIYRSLVKHLEKNLDHVFTLKDIRKEINGFYKKKFNRELEKSSYQTYSLGYKNYMLKAGIIQDKGDGMYQLKSSAESVKLDSPSQNPPRKPPIKLSCLEKWLIKTMPRKVFDIEAFYEDYPEQRQHNARVDKSVSELCNRGILTQMGNNQFKLRVNRIIG